MTLTSFVLLLVIAAVAGMLGQAIGGYALGGCVVSIVLGFVGAYVGMWLADQFHLPEFLLVQVGSNNSFPLFWAIVGSALLSAGVGLLARQRRLL